MAVQKSFASLLEKVEGIIDEIEKRGIKDEEISHSHSASSLKRMKDMGFCQKVIELSITKDQNRDESSKKLRKYGSTKTLNVFSARKHDIIKKSEINL